MRTALTSLALLTTLAALTAQPPSPGGEPAFRVSIPSTTPAATRSQLEAAGYDVSCLPMTAHQVMAVLSLAELQALRGAGLQPVVLEVAQPLQVRLGGGIDLPPGYHDLAAISATLAATQAAHPGIAMVVDAAAVYGPGATLEGRPLELLKISDNVTQDEDEPNILFVACHHAREIVTPEIALDLISRLVTGYGTDPQITALIDANEIWVGPVWNPDGFDYVWNVNNMWRKNRRPNPDGSFGVDQNRNYALGWSGSCAGSTTFSSETYKGPAAESEAETQTMVALGRARRFAKVLDYHSSGQEVLLSYLCSPLPPSIEGLIDAGGVALASTTGYGTRQPSAEGEHYHWEIQEITSYAYLAETATTFQPPYSSALAEAALLWPLALAFLSSPIPLQGHVTDALTGQGIPADLSVAGLTWSQGETRSAHPLFGRYHLFLPAGSHMVTFSAPGYAPQTHNVSVSSGGTTTLDVALLPQAAPFTLDMSTSGGGAGDFHLQLNNIPAGATEGFTLFSFDVSHPVGQGNVFGITADLFTLQGILTPSFPGNPFHWPAPPVPGLFPATPFDLPPGSLPFPASTGVDGQAVAFVLATWTVLGVTNVERIAF